MEDILLLEDPISQRLVLTWPSLCAIRPKPESPYDTWATLANCTHPELASRAHGLRAVGIILESGGIADEASAHLRRLALFRITTLEKDAELIALKWLMHQQESGTLRSWIENSFPELFHARK